MKIITASEEHIPVIRQIARNTWNDAYSSILTEEQSEYMLDWMYSNDSLKDQIKNKNHVFLLVKGSYDEYVGFASYELNYQDKPITKIHKIYILPEYQHQGVGNALVSRIAEIAESNSNKALQLNVNKHNKALEFYKSLGFDVIASECIDIGKGFIMDDYILEKKL